MRVSALERGYDRLTTAVLALAKYQIKLEKAQIETNAEIKALAAETRAGINALIRSGRETDARIEKLVSAIGEINARTLGKR